MNVSAIKAKIYGKIVGDNQALLKYIQAYK